MSTCIARSATTPKPSMAKAVLAGSIGNALEWFDYGLYGYFAAIISSLFFPSKDAHVYCFWRGICDEAAGRADIRPLRR